MISHDDLLIKQDAAILEAWKVTPSYKIFEREMVSMKEADAAMAVNSPWSAQVAGLRANALDELTRNLSGIIERKNQIVAAEIEASQNSKTSPDADAFRPRQAPQAV